ncbi:hypothetical protein [Desulfovibrio sp.]|uniref:hypothetical protein n=1 Tax=Desulfovibrio sp. TaxID=885 RepID=UPI0025C15ED2|nr:hypothetical protein [Desulfovibrio sp.]MCI7568674.1 hypothetical protein [Desulfovibrio sp.]
MDRDSLSDQRDKLLFDISLGMGASSDEYVLRQLKEVSPEYARGYVEAFLCNADEADMLFIYQIIRLMHMARR